MAVAVLKESPVRALPGTSLAQPRYCQVPIIWPGVSVPVHDGSGAEELVGETEGVAVEVEEVVLVVAIKY
jgi:hypothetical protein